MLSTETDATENECSIRVNERRMLLFIYKKKAHMIFHILVPHTSTRGSKLVKEESFHLFWQAVHHNTVEMPASPSRGHPPEVLRKQPHHHR